MFRATLMGANTGCSFSTWNHQWSKSQRKKPKQKQKKPPQIGNQQAKPIPLTAVFCMCSELLSTVTCLWCSFCLLSSLFSCWSELDRKAITPRSMFAVMETTWGTDLRPSRHWKMLCENTTCEEQGWTAACVSYKTRQFWRANKMSESQCVQKPQSARITCKNLTFYFKICTGKIININLGFNQRHKTGERSESQSLCNCSLGMHLNIALKETHWPAVWTGLLCVCAAARCLLDSTASPGPAGPRGNRTWSSHREMPPLRAPPAAPHCCWSWMERGQTG